jgi:hypothetical protein
MVSIAFAIPPVLARRLQLSSFRRGTARMISGRTGQSAPRVPASAQRGRRDVRPESQSQPRPTRHQRGVRDEGPTTRLLPWIRAAGSRPNPAGDVDRIDGPSDLHDLLSVGRLHREFSQSGSRWLPQPVSRPCSNHTRRRHPRHTDTPRLGRRCTGGRERCWCPVPPLGSQPRLRPPAAVYPWARIATSPVVGAAGRVERWRQRRQG